MVSEGAVPRNGDDRRLPLDRAGRETEGDGGADRAGDAVDDTPFRIEHALRPLTDLAAVANEHGIRTLRQKLPNAATEIERVKRPVAGGGRGFPFGRTIAHGSAHLGEPRAVAARRTGRRERLGRRQGRRHAAQHQAVAHVPRHAANRLDVGGEHDEPAGRIDGRRLPEPEGEIEGLPEQHQEIGPPERLRDRTERRVVESAGALHADHGNVQGILQLPRRSPARRGAKHRTADDQGAPRRGDGGERGGRRRLAQRRDHGIEGGRLRPQGRIVRELRLQEIGRQAEVDGTRASRRGDADSAREIVTKVRRALGRP